MKYFFIALIAIGLGFGLAKIATNLANQGTAPVAQNAALQGPVVTQPDTATSTPSTAPQTSPVVPPPPVAKTGAIDNANVTISFTGYGKKNEPYQGAFDKVTANLKLIGSIVVGSITVDMNSLHTSIDTLDTAIASPSFFGIVTYPTASFTFTTWKKEVDGSITATGKLTLKNTTKTVMVPIVFANGTYTADFHIKPSNFGIKSTLMKDDIKLTVTVPTN